MMALPRERGQILILLATWLLFGGGASSALVVYDRPASEMKKAIKRVIADDVRKDALLSNLSDWKSRQKKQDKEVRADREELLESLRRKGTQRSELAPAMAKLDATLEEMDRNFLDLRFHVKTQVTRAEWAQLVARPDR
jgi:hypothetical protein